MTGKTYSLFGGLDSTDRYYSSVKSMVNELLQYCPDPEALLDLIRKKGGVRSLFNRRSDAKADDTVIAMIQEKCRDVLSSYTIGVRGHLKDLPVSRRLDETLRTTEEQYHLFMLEIEVVNRICGNAFRKSGYKVALLPHCLRDFRPACKSVPGDVEYVCQGCTQNCFIFLGSLLLKKYGVHPYISVTIDQKKLFKMIKYEHPDIGALGVACIPELARGMRTCSELGIPGVGIALDTNRCARWMGRSHESSFSFKELKALLQ